MIILLGRLYLGWALGANDASKVFGTAVGAKIISFRNAAVLCAVVVVAGAALTVTRHDGNRLSHQHLAGHGRSDYGHRPRAA